MTNLSTEGLLTIAENLRKQDNRCTALPIFIVEQKRRQYGMDTNYSGDVVWLHADEGEEVDDDEAAELERKYKEDFEEPDGYTRTAYLDSWEFVTACLTEQGCKDYLAVNGHNLKESRIYAASGFRNREWELIRNHFLEMLGHD